MTGGIRLPVVDSTLDEIHARAADGAADGAWVVAREQRAGRGSRGRAWDSGAGGLWLSVLRRADTADGLGLLGLRAALAVAAVLDGLPAARPVLVKWPNDLMVRDRKVGGLLAEARWQGDRLQWVAIGVGINVTNRLPPDLAATATSLGAHCAETTAEALEEPVVAALRGLAVDEPRLTLREGADLAARDWLRGRRISAPAVGVAAGIDAEGRLLVRDASGTVRPVALGTVTLA